MDIAARFCQEYGYALDVVDMSFDALMPAVASGKCDFARTGITITEERAKSVYFSEPNIYDKVVFVTKKKNAHSGSFTQSVADSFRKTFIIESRYKLFLKGIAATLGITILSVIFGTLLGFGMYLLCRKGNKAVTKITSVFAWLIRGMPGVVLLMLPQAAQHFMPAYKGEITALIKATAIVGYITVEDLTRMGDLIRSRTYEPLFPIISVAVIYFILAGILTAAANRLVRAVDTKKRTKEKILKGIEIHDWKSGISGKNSGNL